MKGFKYYMQMMRDKMLASMTPEEQSEFLKMEREAKRNGGGFQPTEATETQPPNVGSGIQKKQGVKICPFMSNATHIVYCKGAECALWMAACDGCAVTLSVVVALADNVGITLHCSAIDDLIRDK